MGQDQFRWVGWASLLYVGVSAIAPISVNAEVVLTRAHIEALQNQVELHPSGSLARPAYPQDRLSLGDSIRTARASRVDLRFNDGSLARIGEQAIFQFVPNTRTFQLSKGTALFMIPPGQGQSAIETPSAVTVVAGTALVVRHIPTGTGGHVGTNQRSPGQLGDGLPGRTVVMVLTENPDDPVIVNLPNGRTTELQVGQMAVVDRGELYVFEFDLALFYETSPLVEDLHLTDPDRSYSGDPTDLVRQEVLEGLANQASFQGEYVLNPAVVSLEDIPRTDTDWLVPLTAVSAPPQPSSPVTAPTPADEAPPIPSVTEAPSEAEVPVAAEDTVPPGQVTPTPGSTPVPSDGAVTNPNVLPPGLINPSNSDVPASPPTPPEPPVNPPQPPVEPDPIDPNPIESDPQN